MTRAVNKSQPTTQLQQQQAANTICQSSMSLCGSRIRFPVISMDTLIALTEGTARQGATRAAAAEIVTPDDRHHQTNLTPKYDTTISGATEQNGRGRSTYSGRARFYLLSSQCHFKHEHPILFQRIGNLLFAVNKGWLITGVNVRLQTQASIGDSQLM